MAPLAKDVLITLCKRSIPVPDAECRCRLGETIGKLGELTVKVGDGSVTLTTRALAAVPNTVNLSTALSLPVDQLMYIFRSAAFLDFCGLILIMSLESSVKLMRR